MLQDRLRLALTSHVYLVLMWRVFFSEQWAIGANVLENRTPIVSQGELVNTESRLYLLPIDSPVNR